MLDYICIYWKKMNLKTNPVNVLNYISKISKNLPRLFWTYSIQISCIINDEIIIIKNKITFIKIENNICIISIEGN